jgi:hypothetical protein
MSVVIHGVTVHEPTKTWMQLMNTRHKVLDKKTNWHRSGWFEGQTQCLANAIRFVIHQPVEMPKSMADAGAESEAERLVLRAIQETYEEDMPEIPVFNDASGRDFKDIQKVLDIAIEWVKPHAQTFAVTYANEVMNEEEKKEIADAVFDAEDKIWAENAAKRGWHWTPYGFRDKKGRFSPEPSRRMKERYEPAAEWSSEAMISFRAWLDGHEERGWGTFWDELSDCNGDKDCEERIKALAAA